MDYNVFRAISGFLDPILDQGPVLVKASCMGVIPSPHTQRLCQLFFQEKDEAILTRNVVFRARRCGLESFLLSVLFWGFPRNQRGRCTTAFNNWEELVALVNQIRHYPRMTSHEFLDLSTAMDDIRGLGISTYSKILYYLNASIDGYPCIILDDMVARGISNLNGQEFLQIQDAAVNGRHRYYANYRQYLEAAHSLAQMNQIPEHNVEFTLWLAGKKNY